MFTPRLIDLSQPVFDKAPNSPIHPPVSFRRIHDHEKDGWRVEEITMVTHTGSHIDAPLHKIPGAKSISDFPIESFAGRARIADLRGLPEDTPVTAAMLAPRLKGITTRDIVLLATGWGDKRAKTEDWQEHSAWLHPEGARWLVERGVRGVGIDHFSLGGLGPLNAETHTILFEAGAWVLEELRFPAEVFSLPQPLKFWALPMNWPGCSGAFCRPVIEVN
jgi:arylformamidase